MYSAMDDQLADLLYHYIVNHEAHSLAQQTLRDGFNFSSLPEATFPSLIKMIEGKGNFMEDYRHKVRNLVRGTYAFPAHTAVENGVVYLVPQKDPNFTGRYCLTSGMLYMLNKREKGVISRLVSMYDNGVFGEDSMKYLEGVDFPKMSVSDGLNIRKAFIVLTAMFESGDISQFTTAVKRALQLQPDCSNFDQVVSAVESATGKKGAEGYKADVVTILYAVEAFIQTFASPNLTYSFELPLHYFEFVGTVKRSNFALTSELEDREDVNAFLDKLFSNTKSEKVSLFQLIRQFEYLRREKIFREADDGLSMVTDKEVILNLKTLESDNPTRAFYLLSLMNDMLSVYCPEEIMQVKLERGHYKSLMLKVANLAFGNKRITLSEADFYFLLIYGTIALIKESERDKLVSVYYNFHLSGVEKRGSLDKKRLEEDLRFEKDKTRSLETKVATLEKQIESSKKHKANHVLELERRVAKMQRELEALTPLKDELELTKSMLASSLEASTSSDGRNVTLKEMVDYLSDFKLIIVGGYYKWGKKIVDILPSLDFINTGKKPNLPIDSIKSKDYVFLHSDYTSHTVAWKAEDLLTMKDNYIRFTPHDNVFLVVKEMYEHVKKKEESKVTIGGN